ncbi:MAG: hypothetical protein LBV38_02735 [Alistipes sp.]|nr:hypothetical protein [Alistipes sp.]
MMTTFQVDASSVEALKFIEFARTLPFVREKKTKRKSTDETIQPMTLEEYHAEIDRSLEDYRAGRVISHEELKNEMNRW